MLCLPLKKLTPALALLALLLFLALFAAGGCCKLACPGPGQLDLEQVKITKVVDGDTVYARFKDGQEEKVRLIGIDAPEINHPHKGLEPFGHEAEVYAREALHGATAWLEFDLGERDQYGRLLAYLWLSAPAEVNEKSIREQMFNAIMLTEGYAVQVTFEPNVKYYDYFSAFAAEAKNKKKGLWGLN